jgi:hypothetical protein
MAHDPFDDPPLASSVAIASHMDPRPGDRLRLIVVYGATLLMLIVLVVSWPSCATLPGSRATLVAFALLAMLTGAFVVRRGRRVLRAGRVPLATDPVWVRTRVRTGRAVQTEAWACFALGASVLLAALLLAGAVVLFPGALDCAAWFSPTRGP